MKGMGKGDKDEGHCEELDRKLRYEEQLLQDIRWWESEDTRNYRALEEGLLKDLW